MLGVRRSGLSVSLRAHGAQRPPLVPLAFHHERGGLLRQPALVPLVFDGPGVQNSVGDLSLIQFRHLKDQACIGYIEGEAKSLTVDAVTR